MCNHIEWVKHTLNHRSANDQHEFADRPNAKSCKLFKVILPSNGVFAQKRIRDICDTGMM